MEKQKTIEIKIGCEFSNLKRSNKTICGYKSIYHKSRNKYIARKRNKNIYVLFSVSEMEKKEIVYRKCQCDQ